ncbi:MAG: rhodanese-like domain-containing protein [Armatimonadota bacterium]
MRTRHFVLAPALFAVALMVGCDGAALDSALLPTTVENISAAELEALMESQQRLVVLDVRSASEYETGHIPGSVNVPLDELAARHGELDPNVPVVCVCSSAFRSLQAAHLLVSEGFDRVMYLEGGLSNYCGPWDPDCPTCY